MSDSAIIALVTSFTAIVLSPLIVVLVKVLLSFKKDLRELQDWKLKTEAKDEAMKTLLGMKGQNDDGE